MTSITMHDGRVVLHQADCRDVLRSLADNSIDSVVTDPPYALVSIQKRFGKPGSAPAKDVYGRGAAGFMGKTWDTGEVAFSEEFWAEVLRVLKPGGHVVAFSGTRTYHRMAVAIEDAGFEIRDQLGWVYGSGFPKSHDVSKGIDKNAGHWRGKAGSVKVNTVGQVAKGTEYERTEKGAAITADAIRWQGWGTALKPAWEPICLARKPLLGTVAENVLEHGTGAINIDGCRIEGEGGSHREGEASQERRYADAGGTNFAMQPGPRGGSPLGRWPANIVHDGSDEVLTAFPDAPGRMAKAAEGEDRRKDQNVYGAMTRGSNGATPRIELDKSAARFFYCAKASRADRDAGLDHLPKKAGGMVSETSGQHLTRLEADYKPEPRANIHPTVKPTTLMQWLCRLITPPGGVILDPFMGSGSTGKAAVLEGFQFIGCEREDEYMPIATARIAWSIGAADNDRPERPAVAPQQLAANDNDLFSAIGAAA